MFLALVAGGGTVEAPLWSRDTRASHDAIRAFGAATVATDAELVVRGARIRPAEIDAVNSGTTLRIATAIAALADGESRLAGDASLNTRPMGPLADALEQLGAEVTLDDDGTPPLAVEGPIEGGSATVDASRSSQFVTALLLAGPRMPEGLDLEIKGELTSEPYVDLTCRWLENVGVDLERSEGSFRIEHDQQLAAVNVPVPGDYSAAAFPLVAAAATGGHVTVANLPEDTGQGDERVAEMIGAFGAPVEREGDTLTVRGKATQPAEIDLSGNPDLFPALAVLAATVEGTSELTGAPHLRDKESDRIQAMVEGLNELGVQTEALEGGARIQGGLLSGGTVDAHEDHRIQMAFAVAGLAAQKAVTITGPLDAHAVSYPGFLDALRELGAKLETNPTDGQTNANPEPREGTR